MKHLLPLLLILHGAIHLMGFVKAFELARINEIHHAISRPAGIVWLLVAVLFITAGVLHYFSDRWFIPAFAATVLSTVLVIATWSDSRFGMIPNMIILIACVIAFATWNYKNVYHTDIRKAASLQGTPDTSFLTENDLARLPLPVQQYIRLAGFVGKPRVTGFKTVFEGKIRKDETAPWMPFTCEQHNFLKVPTRLFFMDATMKGLPVAGYHHFKNGTAVMDIRLLSLLKVQYAEGPEMDQSETVTFFNDMCVMAPAMLTDERITWIETNGNTVTCSFTNNGITVHATLFFNDKGELVNFISNDRFAYGEKGTMTKVPWQTPIKKYVDIRGYHLPAEAEMIYNYPEGDLCYGVFGLREVDY